MTSTENPKVYRKIYILSAAKLRFSSSLAARDRVFRRQKERQHLHTRSAAISLLSLSLLSRFSDKLYLPSRYEELGLGEPMHARTESRGECRFTQNRSPFLRDCWPTDSEGEERRREGNTPLRRDRCKCGYVSGRRRRRTQENI